MDKYKNKPWLLEEMSWSVSVPWSSWRVHECKVLPFIDAGREFVAIPADSLYNFNKVARYGQLTIEEEKKC
ncbi:hypothetical protein Droror1_Dr00010227 [Drosera rotundifolia]